MYQLHLFKIDQENQMRVYVFRARLKLKDFCLSLCQKIENEFWRRTRKEMPLNGLNPSQIQSSVTCGSS